MSAPLTSLPLPPMAIMSAAPTSTAPSAADTQTGIPSSSTSPSLAHSTLAHLPPVDSTTPLVLSLPPAQVDTIQDEIEQSTEWQIPPGGIAVHAIRHDGIDAAPLTGILVSVLESLTLASPLPEHRNPLQQINVRATVKSEFASGTIEEYWAARMVQYPNPDSKDSASAHRIRICQVALDDGEPFIYPADQIWRLDGVKAEQKADIGDLRAPTTSSTPVLSPEARLWIQVADDPWKLSAWQELLALTQQTQNLFAIRHVLHSFLKVFPSSATHWKSLIELELTHKQYAEVERILPGAIRRLPEIDLWRTYLVYQKIIHTPPEGESSDEKVREMNVAIEAAYEFVLEHMGLDLHSGQIWKSYINFVRGISVRSPVEEAGKTASLRKLYQRVLSIPIQPKELNWFWDEYQDFEKSVGANFANKTLMNKMLADWQTKYNFTSKESMERRKKYAGILSASIGSSYGLANTISQTTVHIANRPSPSELHQTKDALQMQLWMRYLKFESRKLEGQDMHVYKSRVVLAYRQCLMYCRHYPNVWFDYVHFLQTPKLYFPQEQIRAAWKEFHEAMPYSILPTLIHADVEEEAKRFQEAKLHYESLLTCKKPEEEPSEDACFDLPRFVNEEYQRVRAAEIQAKKESEDATAAAGGNTAMTDASKEEEKKEDDLNKYQGKIDIYKGELHRTHPLVYILLMRFLRRTEGVDAARKVFLLARRSPFLTYHTYLFAAHIEHHVNNDLQKAQAIYAHGMKTYGDANEAYLLKYIQFLQETNDQNNLRLIFGRVLLTESAELAEMAQHLSRKESAQMRKAQQANLQAAQNKDNANNGAVNIIGIDSPNYESASDPVIPSEQWWAHVNGLIEDSSSSASPSTPAPSSTTSSDRHSYRGGHSSRHGVESTTGLHFAFPSCSMLSLWNTYVTFERETANELAVLMRAEEKRDMKLGIRYTHHLATWLDRWKWLELWPCSLQMRQTLEKMMQSEISKLMETVEELQLQQQQQHQAEQESTAAAAAGPTSSTSAVSTTDRRARGLALSDVNAVASFKSGLFKPDLSRLHTFAASAQPFDRDAVRVRYGATVRVPEQILNVMSVLPAAHLFHGPYVHPQTILDCLPLVPTIPDAPAAAPIALVDTSAVSTAASSAGKKDRRGRYERDNRDREAGKKRKQRDGEPEEEAEELATADTANDLYRKRQQQKLAKQNE